MSDYEMKIVSKHAESDGEVFRSFMVDGERTIGVKRNEPFEIHIKNNRYEELQVRLSLDGTDILTGEIANTNSEGEMWHVDPLGTLVVKAFPENYNGGSRFVFTDGKNGVAVNTHGEESAIGLIGAAVFTEGERLNIFNPRPIDPCPYPWKVYPYVTWTNNTFGITGGGGTYSSSGPISSCNSALKSCSSFGEQNDLIDEDLSVGAGEYVEQEIINKPNFRKPILSKVLQIRYMPWTKLSKIVGVSDRVQRRGKSAFPGDNFGINLDNVPRVKSTGNKNNEYKSNRFV